MYMHHQRTAVEEIGVGKEIYVLVYVVWQDREIFKSLRALMQHQRSIILLVVVFWQVYSFFYHLKVQPTCTCHFSIKISSLFLKKETGKLYSSAYRLPKSYQQRAMNQGLIIESLKDRILYICFFTPKMKIYNTIPLNFLRHIKSILKTPPISFLPHCPPNT